MHAEQRPSRLLFLGSSSGDVACLDDCTRREGVTPTSRVGANRDDPLMIADEVIAELTAPPFRRYDDLAARPGVVRCRQFSRQPPSSCTSLGRRRRRRAGCRSSRALPALRARSDTGGSRTSDWRRCESESGWPRGSPRIPRRATRAIQEHWRVVGARNGWPPHRSLAEQVGDGRQQERCPKERQEVSEGLHEVLVPARVLSHSDPPYGKHRGHLEKSVRLPRPPALTRRCACTGRFSAGPAENPLGRAGSRAFELGYKSRRCAGISLLSAEGEGFEPSMDESRP